MKKIISIIVTVLSICSVQAQGLQALLSAIEQNNTQLRSVREANASILSQAKAENNLGETSVEYSPFYQSGVDGTSSSELIVSQEFDFPTLYASRRKANSLLGQELDLQYLIQRRDILLVAKKVSYDLCRSLRLKSLMQLRLQTADSLLMAFEKRMRQGDASLIDLNRIKMDRMSVNAEYIKNEALCKSLSLELRRLNGGEEVDSYITELANSPVSSLEAVSTLSSPILETSAAEATLKSSQQAVRIAQQGWTPKLTLGYRRDTELREASNGFLVGVSVPLFSNSGKVKAAKHQRSVAELELTDTQVAQDARRENLNSQREHLRLLLDVYDEPLMHQTLTLLNHAVLAGELSVIDYYTEADRIYQLLQERIDNENEYLKVLAELNREQL